MKKLKIKLIIIIIFLFIALIELGILIVGRVQSNKIKLQNQEPYVTFESRIESVANSKIADTTTVGWIQVQGTDIDYPVIKETQAAYQSGIDYIWQPYNYIEGNNRESIYGHNILNVSSQPLIRHKNHVRFEQLLGFSYYEVAKENLYIQYTNHGNDEIYKIYAISFLYSNDDLGENYRDEKEIQKYIKSAKKSSIYNYDVNVSENDKLISLVTCTRYFGVNGKTKFRIDARKLRKNENITKYSVETNKNYDIMK